MLGVVHLFVFRNVKKTVEFDDILDKICWNFVFYELKFGVINGIVLVWLRKRKGCSSILDLSGFVNG